MNPCSLKANQQTVIPLKKIDLFPVHAGSLHFRLFQKYHIDCVRVYDRCPPS